MASALAINPATATVHGVQARRAATTRPGRAPRLQQRWQRRQRLPPAAVLDWATLAALDIDWSDPEFQVGALGGVLGLVMGIGVPIFYVARTERDEERLEELRALNRATKEETGEYLTEEEIAAIRPPRWTDRREFVDDD